MEFQILGPLEVRGVRGVVTPAGSKPRAILAVLLLHPNEHVSAERLVIALWGKDAPASAVKRLHVHVSRLRKALREPAALTTTQGGYRLRVRPGELDAERFERLADDGRVALQAGEPERAADLLREALSLWRGPPLADLEFEPFAQAEIARLEEQRLAAVEARVEADLAAGRHAPLVGELQRLVAANPTRERFAGQLMLALYRSRRQADALAVYRDTRRMLVEELGLEPSEELRRLESQMLAQVPHLEAPARVEAAVTAAPAPTRADSRRVVSVVHIGLADAPALAARLDSEALHGVLDRCWDDCASAIERHGGVVERIATDAIVGAFGLAALHEDDALRAIRAAAEVRAADDVELRVGIATGEVFVGAGGRSGRFATGEPFTAAARLEAAAAAGEILLGAGTHELVEPVVRAEPLGPAWRLIDLSSHATEWRGSPATPFVGREAELAELHSAFARASGEPGCRLVTVVGPPGIGKSRLARELLDSVRGDAAVVVGRCLSYGEGITYHPLAEIVRQLGHALPLELDERAARRVLAAAGAPDEPGRAEETFWAFRRLFESLARKRPLVVVVEDVHWAEPTLLDLLEHVVAFSSGSPILLVCLARPELMEVRPSWAPPRPNRSMVVLDALAPEESRELARSLGAAEQAAQIVDTAEGNPFFLEQLIAVRAEDEDAALPPSIRAVLAARIDRLEPEERAVLSHGSVQGRSFHAGAVAETLPDDGLPAHLVALVRKQLIRSDPSEFAGEDAFRFAHALIRDAAYEGLPKQRRAELHERLGRWLTKKPDAQDEIIGYHLEQAYRYCAELARVGEPERALAADAAQRLATAARAALVRGDLPAGARLLERATSLLEPDDPARNALLPALGVALFEAGRLADAERVVTDAIARSEARQDSRLEARARVEQQVLRFHAGSGVEVAEARRVADRATRVLARHRDELGQCRAWRLRAWVEWTEGQVAAADDAWLRAAEHARAAGDDGEFYEILGWRASAAAFGPTPVPEAIRRCTAIRREVRNSPVADAVTLHPLGLLHAMKGDFDEARRLIRKGNEVLDELGRMQSVVSHHEAAVELLAGQPAAAERRLRVGYAKLDAMGERSLLATTAAMLAQAVYEQDRYDQAEALCEASEHHADTEDLVTHAMWRGVRARVLARRGRLDEAEALGREAVALAARTDELMDHGDALLALADVLELRGRPEDADAAARKALELYDRKGAAVMVDRARSRVRQPHGASGRS